MKRFLRFQAETRDRFEAGELSKQAAQLAIEHFWAGALRRAVIDGDVENGSVMAGQSVGMVTAEQPTAEIIAELVGQAVAALAAGEDRRPPPRGRAGGPVPLNGEGRAAPTALPGCARQWRTGARQCRNWSQLVAAELVSEVCSIYATRPGEILELAATQGLNPEAVGRTRLRVGEGIVGLCAATGQVMNLPDAQNHPAFAYRPETGEEPFASMLAVPVRRAGRTLGVVAVQNRNPRGYSDEEVDELETVAMLLAEILAGQRRRRWRRRRCRRHGASGVCRRDTGARHRHRTGGAAAAGAAPAAPAGRRSRRPSWPAARRPPAHAAGAG